MRICSSLWVLVMALWLAAPEQEVWAAEVKASNEAPKVTWRSAFTRHTVVGLALTGSGLLLIRKGFDFRDEADALYRRYLDALDPAEISLLYQRTTQRDLKSRFSWTLGAILAGSGIHMLFGRQLAALHLELAPLFPGNHPYSAQLQLSRDF